ncbi:MAG: glycoside hydrolase family 3 N-terminal domain-containing protein, partial [Kiritimatiellota bacterium]|nr:glycoside hydrolase family 3 N-terminal domain-containing protein [Kiritimatiellota bacterium]
MAEKSDIEKAAYKNKSLTPAKRAADLLGRMTLEEKVGQLQAYMHTVELSASFPWAGWSIYGAMSTAERRQFTLSRDISKQIQAGIGHFTVLLRDLEPGDAAKMANRVQREAVENSRLGIPVMIHDEGLHGLLANGATSFPQAIALSSTWDVE